MVVIVNGEITGSGVLTPVRDVPYARVIEELNNRGIAVNQRVDLM